MCLRLSVDNPFKPTVVLSIKLENTNDEGESSSVEIRGSPISINDLPILFVFLLKNSSCE